MRKLPRDLGHASCLREGRSKSLQIVSGCNNKTQKERIKECSIQIRHCRFLVTDAGGKATVSTSELLRVAFRTRAQARLAYSRVLVLQCTSRFSSKQDHQPNDGNDSHQGRDQQTIL